MTLVRSPQSSSDNQGTNTGYLVVGIARTLRQDLFTPVTASLHGRLHAFNRVSDLHDFNCSSLPLKRISVNACTYFEIRAADVLVQIHFFPWRAVFFVFCLCCGIDFENGSINIDTYYY